MKLKTLKTKIILVIAIFTSTVFAVSPLTFAQSSEEIGQEIANQQSQLAQSQKELEELQNNLKNYQAAIDASSGELPKLQAELDKNESEIKAKALELEVAKQGKKIKELEKQQRQMDQQGTLKTSYMDWRGNSVSLGQFVNTEFDHKKIEQYASSFTGAQQRNIFSIAADLTKLESDIGNFDKKIKELEDLKNTLATKKKELEDQIAYFNGALAYGSAEMNNLGASIQSIKQNIDGLLQEQILATHRQNEILSQNPTPTPNPNPPPTGTGIRFMSQGRDLYQGHGVGMSQWGAHGMGQAGYSYQNILKFYFTGVEITGGYENTIISVNENYGNNNIVNKQINIEDFVAGQAEIPVSWPIEAVKAQVVAFRTYVLKYIALYGVLNVCYAPAYANGTCSTSTVAYNDTQNTRAAVDQTRGQVITYNGALIEALYSADNNQGNGTANNDTIFQNIYGDGTPYPYLRAVNDSAVATNTYYTYWQQRTNTYSYDSIRDMILYNANIGYYNANISNVLRSVINDIGGSITSMSFERDPSQRVKKVWFTGPNGQQRSIGGWWFKDLWVNWVYDMGTYDYIYSQTFYLEVQ